MNRKTTLSALLGAVVIGTMGLAHMAEARSKDTSWQNAKPIGAPVDCIDIRSIQHTRVRSDKVIDFYISQKKIMRNELPYSCSSLGFEERFLYKTSLSRLCSIDTITVLHDAGGLSFGASCGLGKFQQVEIPKK
jgi:hypothetical protein